MTLPFWCLFAVVLIPYVLAGLGGYHRTQQFGEADNRAPRVQAAKLQGAGARAMAAQSNAWEAVAVFASAVFVAHLAGADPTWSGRFAVVFVLVRVLHPIFYIQDMPTPRSASFMVGLVCCISLFVLAIRA